MNLLRFEVIRMDTQSLDIWNQWGRKMSLVIKAGNPIIDNTIYVYTHGENGLINEALFKVYDNHGGPPEKGNYILQNDSLINMLYFAAIRAKVGIKVFGLNDKDIEVSADELKGMETVIDQLDTIFAYKTNRIGLEEFARAFKNQTLYYSTLVGDTDNGRQAFFACSTEGDKNRYYPVFLTEGHLGEFFTKYHRSAHMILQDNLEHFLSVLDSNNMVEQLGVVIEPLYDCNVSIPPLFRIK